MEGGRGGGRKLQSVRKRWVIGHMSPGAFLDPPEGVADTVSLDLSTG